jgi:hypothetical protein
MARHSVGTDKTVEDLKTKKQKVVSKCLHNETTKTDHTCSRVLKDKTCSAFAYPSAKWRIGDCPLADQELRLTVIEEPKKKVRVGQQKQKRR